MVEQTGLVLLFVVLFSCKRIVEIVGWLSSAQWFSQYLVSMFRAVRAQAIINAEDVMDIGIEIANTRACACIVQQFDHRYNKAPQLSPPETFIHFLQPGGCKNLSMVGTDGNLAFGSPRLALRKLALARPFTRTTGLSSIYLVELPVGG